MSSFVAFRGEGGLPQAVVVTGAGSEAANGIYRASAKEYCDAPIYEHSERGAEFKITREPHKNQKTGQVKHGWLLGEKKTPLYGVPTESLAMPATGWKKFNGQPPIPTIKVHDKLTDVFYSIADETKSSGDLAADNQDWVAARAEFSKGIDNLKRSGERFGESFKNRAALLLSRRANANFMLTENEAALRDAVAALDLVRGLTSAEVTATEAAKALGCKTDAMVQKVLEPVGTGNILDTGAPLVLRCVERWISEVMKVIEADGEDAVLPAPTHQPSDRYLDGLDEEQRQEIIKRYMPDAMRPYGGTGIIHSPKECLEVMAKWEAILSSSEFQDKRAELWERKDLNLPARMMEFRNLIAESVAPVIEPMGFATGRPGLTRCVKQMQHYWSNDLTVARKATDLEELADVSLADLECSV